MTVNTDKANPLRIGLMLRAIDDVDGQGIYTRKLCDALFDLDTRNEYVAFLQRRAPCGASFPIPLDTLDQHRGRMIIMPCHCSPW